jgi:hypothetical protein
MKWVDYREFDSERRHEILVKPAARVDDDALRWWFEAKPFRYVSTSSGPACIICCFLSSQENSNLNIFLDEVLLPE